LHELPGRHLQRDRQRYQLRELPSRHLQFDHQRHRLHELRGGVLGRRRHLRVDGVHRDHQPRLLDLSELPGPTGHLRCLVDRQLLRQPDRDRW